MKKNIDRDMAILVRFQVEMNNMLLEPGASIILVISTKELGCTEF